MASVFIFYLKTTFPKFLEFLNISSVIKPYVSISTSAHSNYPIVLGNFFFKLPDLSIVLISFFMIPGSLKKKYNIIKQTKVNL